MKTKVLQFGEGNFLRGYFDWMVQRMNERANFGGSVRIVQPRRADLAPVSQALNAAGGRYAVCLRGLENGRPVESFEDIACVEGVSGAGDAASFATLPDLRFVVSNTTEAGIKYRPGADTFPAKVARLLRARWAAGLPGLVFLPCELIERNGETLRDCVLRHAADDAGPDTATRDGLEAWIRTQCVFCSTLVDRIVSGAPDAESAARYARMPGVDVRTLVCCEPFHFLAVQVPEGFDLEAEMPLAAAGLSVAYVRDLAPYRTRKVRFLNGAHTATVPQGLLAGFTEVAQLVADPHFNALLRQILFKEVFPTVALPDAEKRAYAESVLERFANPFAHHRLRSIALNSVAKWRVRVLPTVLDHIRLFGRLPEALWESLDWLIRLYEERPNLVEDAPEVAAFFKTRPTRRQVLANTAFWGLDLNEIAP